MSSTALNRTNVTILTNKSGGSVAQGDVVIVDSANASAFTTTTTSGYVNGQVGVVLEPNGIADNTAGLVAFSGYIPIINLSASASLGDLVKTHTVAKQGVRHAAPLVAGDFAEVLETGTTPAAILFGKVNQGGSGGLVTGSTDNAVLRADGTGGSTSQGSLATIDDSGTVDIPTGQTYNINGSPHTHAGGGTPFYLDTVALDGTYGDHFTAATLAAIWTRHNLTSSDDVRQSADGSHLRITFTNAHADESYLQTVPVGDWEIQGKFARVSGLQASMMGLMAVDSSGNGVGLMFYNDGNVYLMTLATYAYSSTGSAVGGATGRHLGDKPQNGETVWLSLIKSGTSYSGRISQDGTNWSPVGGPDTHANTIDRFGFGRIFGAIAGEVAVIDWFNKI